MVAACFTCFICSIVLLGCGVLSVCPSGRFGWKCNLRCVCRVGTDRRCHQITGQCLDGCDLERYGNHCLFSSSCLYDTVGRTYFGSRDTTHFGYKCVANATSAPMLPQSVAYCQNPVGAGLAYLPWCHVVAMRDGRAVLWDYCDIPFCSCPEHLFGDGCNKQCHCRNQSEVCHPATGLCVSGCADGFLGSSCQRACTTGWYGKGCRHQCTNCHNRLCQPETGACPSGCRKGFSGQYCDQPCRVGQFGPNCAHYCGHCVENAPCDPVTGFCQWRCAPGYEPQDAMCKIECQHGWHGIQCRGQCGHCQDRDTCNHVTGVCNHGCLPGYCGADCKTGCAAHFYGDSCLQKCGKCRGNATCDPAYGHCLFGCAEGYYGDFCNHEHNRGLTASVKLIITISIISTVLVLMLVMAVVIVVSRRIRRNKRMSSCSNFIAEMKEEGINCADSESCVLLGEQPCIGQPQIPELSNSEWDDDSKGSHSPEPIYVNVNSRRQSAPVHLDHLQVYIAKNKVNNCDGFRKEFEELPMGLLAPCEVARRPGNKSKNRYGNIIAYDHSRVILEPVSLEPSSDYINANFLDGYKKPRMFIACQGPNRMMVSDLWRMVWQEKVSKMVMLTNQVESCKKKCEQYWPDNGQATYSDVTVSFVHIANYTNFNIRTFEISKGESSRVVKHFHFTGWSDHGAPTCPTALLIFRHKVQSFNPDSEHPVLCHCSAGIGRTGTYIGLHYLIDQAAEEGRVDVLRAVHIMRSNRVNMIQTCEQYVFVYDALLEAVLSADTTISKSLFCSVKDACSDKFGVETRLEREYETLRMLSPSVDRTECSSALLDENLSKNRIRNILPRNPNDDRFVSANHSRPFLQTPVTHCNDYINAVVLPAYRQNCGLIVTQMPLPHTVADFWRLLYDYSSCAVVMLNEFDRNDKSCALYWPEEYGYMEQYGPLGVELLSSSDVDHDVTIRIFKLSHAGRGEERAIKQYMFKSWTDYHLLPDTITSLLRLFIMVRDWCKLNDKGPITVHCMNGSSKCGVLAAISLILERLDEDMEVDVFQSVKQNRIHRPQFIEGLDQYRFLYQVVLEYLDSWQ